MSNLRKREQHLRQTHEGAATLWGVQERITRRVQHPAGEDRMRGLSGQVTSLEAVSGARGFVCIRRYSDQTEADAIAAYEAAHGLIERGDNVLNVIIRKPIPAPGRA